MNSNMKYSPRMVSGSSMLLALMLVSCSLVAAEDAPIGVVVENVWKGSAGEKAGLTPGDRLFSWERPANSPANPESAEGAYRSTFDWMWVEMEQGPRGSVKINGERDGKACIFEIPMGSWKIEVRPNLSERFLKIYLEGKAAIDANDIEKGAGLWRDIVKGADADGDMRLASWLDLQIGHAYDTAERPKEAQAAFNEAMKAAQQSTDAVAQSFVLDAIGESFEEQNDIAKAKDAYDAARAFREEKSSESLGLAVSLVNLGYLEDRHGDSGRAEALYSRALAIREKLAPDSLDVAQALVRLGSVAEDRGDLDQAEERLLSGLAIQEKLAPDSIVMASTLNNLGITVSDRGDLDSAEAYYERALAISQKQSPDSISVLRSLCNLGVAFAERGNLASAEADFRRALAMAGKLAPNSYFMVSCLNNLGALAIQRGDLAAAETSLKSALAIQEKLTPEGVPVEFALNNLGAAARARGDLAGAESYYKRALAIQNRSAHDHLNSAIFLSNLGEIADDRGDIVTAETYYQHALTIREKLAPGSLAMATSLFKIGEVARERGKLIIAEKYYGRALVIREKLAPGSLFEAEPLNALAVLFNQTGRPLLASKYFTRSIDALEFQEGKLGGSQEKKPGFAANYIHYYQDYIEYLIAQGRQAEAFHVLERSRARGFIEMLAERDLVFTDIPRELSREQKKIAFEYDQVQSKLGDLNPVKEHSQAETLLERLRQLRGKREEIRERIREKSPRLASLKYPKRLTLTEVQKILDPGTVLLSYCVTRNKTFLFAVRSGLQSSSQQTAAPQKLFVYTVPIHADALRKQVDAFRNLIQDAEKGIADQSALIEPGSKLFDELIRPAEPMISPADRLLICPDGPLHVLPFAALIQATGNAPDVPPQYLVQWKPLHIVLSGTVYSELIETRGRVLGKAPTTQLVAFADPKYPLSWHESPDGISDPQAQWLLTRGLNLQPLPATRTEVEGIASVFQDKIVSYIGEEATEERAKTIGSDVRYIHFACHGFCDEQSPLDSSLALTVPERQTPGQDNGFLQAWEIFEKVRIRADLVTLSACKSALGKELGGEGLIGLSRAFQYAGARSVLASLWDVSDQTTAELMRRFYGYLKAGKTKDEALRAAQIDLITSPARFTAHPYHWAAFELIGDWK